MNLRHRPFDLKKKKKNVPKTSPLREVSRGRMTVEVGREVAVEGEAQAVRDRMVSGTPTRQGGEGGDDQKDADDYRGYGTRDGRNHSLGPVDPARAAVKTASSRVRTVAKVKGGRPSGQPRPFGLTKIRQFESMSSTASAVYFET